MQNIIKIGNAIYWRSHKSINLLKLNRHFQHEHKSRLKRIGGNDKAHSVQNVFGRTQSIPYGIEWRHQISFRIFQTHSNKTNVYVLILI